MDLSIKELQEDYERWESAIGEDTYSSPRTIGILDVLRAHYLIISRSRKSKTGLMLEHLSDAPETFNGTCKQESQAAQRQPEALWQL